LPYLEKWSEIMFRYKLLRKKGEGTFSEVLKAQNIETGSLHAIKCMKQKFSSLEQVKEILIISSRKCC
jgi:renal tumor antigen